MTSSALSETIAELPHKTLRKLFPEPLSIWAETSALGQEIILTWEVKAMQIDPVEAGHLKLVVK